MDWLVYSCCSHLEHTASVKCFVSLQFLNLRHSVGLLGRVISPSQGRYLTETQNNQKETSMPRVGFEPTIPAFKRAKTVHTLDRATTVIGHMNMGLWEIVCGCESWMTLPSIHVQWQILVLTSINLCVQLARIDYSLYIVRYEVWIHPVVSHSDSSTFK
jgi:hypothetical protein